jgi:hypothetical protein
VLMRHRRRVAPCRLDNIYFYVIVVEIILAIGFFLLLFGANPSAGFTQWAYRNLDRVMEPFRGIFTPIQLGTTNGNVEAVFETSVIFAMIVYGIVAMLLSAATTWLSQRLRKLDAAEAEVERQEAAQAALAAAPATAPAAATLPTTPAAWPATPVAPAAPVAPVTLPGGPVAPPSSPASGPPPG